MVVVSRWGKVDVGGLVEVFKNSFTSSSRPLEMSVVFVVSSTISRRLSIANAKDGMSHAISEWAEISPRRRETAVLSSVA